MPHLAPGQLSEVELTKILGACLWEDISDLVGCRPSEIVNEFDERLYASFLCFELCLAQRSLVSLGEDCNVVIRHGVSLHAGKFAEGFATFDQSDAPDEVPPIRTRADLATGRSPWAYAVNGFVTRSESNTRLKLFGPRGIHTDAKSVGPRPWGLSDHEKVFATGAIPDFGPDYRPQPLPVVREEPVEYAIVPESDLNGAGLVYFARYIAMMNYAERVFLRRHVRPTFSNHLIRFLSTDHRRVYYFANADDTDTVQISVSVAVLPPGAFPPEPQLGPLYRVPFKLQLRFDLTRGSDGTLMATSIVRKSLTIPARMKGLLAEARRLTLSWT